MSDILFVIPSVREHRVLFPEFNGLPEHGGVNTFRTASNKEVDTLVTGAGPFLTTYHLGRHLTLQNHGLFVQLGICGSHDPELGLGSVVHVNKDEFSGFGAEDHNSFIDATSLGFYDEEPLLHHGNLGSDLNADQSQSIRDLPEVRGITVWSATGSSETASRINSKFGPVIETMEGAAFYYCCNKQGLHCMQIRSVSNMAGPRDRDAWEIENSLSTLRKYIEENLISNRPGDEK